MTHIRFCEKDNKFTLEEVCPICGEKTILPLPPKYSPEDPYAEYRRKAKEDFLREKGYL
jgi:H/ACA ribonucleoprotein complex subunit 3